MRYDPIWNRRTGRTTRIIESMPDTIEPGRRVAFVIPWPNFRTFIRPMIEKIKPGISHHQVDYVTLQGHRDMWKLKGYGHDQIFADHTVWHHLDAETAAALDGRMGYRHAAQA